MTNVNTMWLKIKLLDIKLLIQQLDEPIKELHDYYRHQNDELKSASSQLVGSWQYVKDIDHVLDSLQEIIDIEEDV
jgi:hypothetical protein